MSVDCSKLNQIVIDQCAGTSVQGVLEGTAIDGNTTGYPAGATVIVSINQNLYSGIVDSQGLFLISPIAQADLDAEVGNALTLFIDFNGCTNTFIIQL